MKKAYLDAKMTGSHLYLHADDIELHNTRHTCLNFNW
jgi:hypothetical protein